MQFRIKAKNKPVKVSFKIKNFDEVYVIAYDKVNSKRVFFSRFISANNTLTDYSFAVPKSSNLIELVFINKTGQQFSIKEIKAKELVFDNNFVIDAQTHEFIEFAELMAYKMPNLKKGKYTDKNKQFQITILPEISHTAARIEENTNEIQLSKKHFNNKTTAGMFWILVHEYAHNFMNKNSECELEADDFAISIYLNRGYSKMQAIYVIASFSENKLNYTRMVNMINKAEKYNSIK